jgi:hypothetical protein
MNLQQQEQFYQWMTRLKANSRAASSTELREAERRVTEMINGQLISKPAKKVTLVEKQEQEPIVIDLQKSKAGSKYYDMSLPSTGDQVYKCGLHDFETKNLIEFKAHVEDHGSKAASVPVNKLQEILRFQRSNGRL